MGILDAIKEAADSTKTLKVNATSLDKASSIPAVGTKIIRDSKGRMVKGSASPNTRGGHTSALKNLLLELTDDGTEVGRLAVAFMRGDVVDGRLSPTGEVIDVPVPATLRFAAMQFVADRIWGKATESIKVEATADRSGDTVDVRDLTDAEFEVISIVAVREMAKRQEKQIVTDDEPVLPALQAASVTLDGDVK